MSYASREDMYRRFGPVCLAQLAPPDQPDPEGPDGPEGPALDAALRDASETIDGFVCRRYRVPLSPVTGQVTRWCCDIARWYLDRSRTDEAVRKAYEDAISMLRSIADKDVPKLECAGLEAESAAPGGRVASSGPPRFYSAASLGGF